MKIKNIKKKIKNNEENQLITTNTNIEYNNNEDNRLRINGSNIEDGNNESNVVISYPDP